MNTYFVYHHQSIALLFGAIAFLAFMLLAWWGAQTRLSPLEYVRCPSCDAMIDIERSCDMVLSMPDKGSIKSWGQCPACHREFKVTQEPPRPDILMLTGNCWNEHMWAYYASAAGNIRLVRQDNNIREVMDASTYVSDRTNHHRWRFNWLNEALLGLPMALATWRENRIRSGKRWDVIIAYANPMAMGALLLRPRKLVVVVVDQLPVTGLIHVRIHRWLSAQITKFLCWRADEVWLASPRMTCANSHPNVHTAQIHINSPITLQRPNGCDGILYVGVPSPDHDMIGLFRQPFNVHIFGESKYLNSIKHLAGPNVHFYPFTKDQHKISRIAAGCFCGWAVYKDWTDTSYSYYGFPSKTLHYLANDLPVVTNLATYFGSVLCANGIGFAYAVLSSEKVIRSEATRSRVRAFRDHNNQQVAEFIQSRLCALLKS